MQVLWCCPVNLVNIPIRSECLSVVCSHFNITPTPTSSLTLQYFCVDKSQSVSYKTLKVYLATIHLMYKENSFTDPTTDESLHLVCRGIRRQQNSSKYVRLPITIKICKAADNNQSFANPQIVLLRCHCLNNICYGQHSYCNSMASAVQVS